MSRWDDLFYELVCSGWLIALLLVGFLGGAAWWLLTRPAGSAPPPDDSTAVAEQAVTSVNSPSPPPRRTPASRPTATPTSPALYGYTNAVGGYAFNYPSTWSGTETLGDVVFALPGGASVYVHTEPAMAGQTLDEFVAEVNEFPPYDILASRTITLGGEPALCQETANPGEAELQAVSCLALRGGLRYFVSLADLSGLSSDIIMLGRSEFEALLNSFFFLESP